MDMDHPWLGKTESPFEQSRYSHSPLQYQKEAELGEKSSTQPTTKQLLFPDEQLRVHG